MLDICDDRPDFRSNALVAKVDLPVPALPRITMVNSSKLSFFGSGWGMLVCFDYILTIDLCNLVLWLVP